MERTQPGGLICRAVVLWRELSCEKPEGHKILAGAGDLSRPTEEGSRDAERRMQSSRDLSKPTLVCVR